MSVESPPSLGLPGGETMSASRLIVAWQHPVDRGYYPVGILDAEPNQYHFRYLRRALETPDFRPLLGFPDFGRDYRAERLFPLFRQRVMDARRPDYTRFIESLDLRPGASHWEQLERSGGQRPGDAIQLFREPYVSADGRTSHSFLVHGIRHIEEVDPGVPGRISALRVGERLSLLDEPDNPKNELAIQVATGERRILGWVPNLLLDYVYTVRRFSDPQLVVEHVNPVTVPYHLRLRVRIEGYAPRGYRPFRGPGWELAIAE